MTDQPDQGYDPLGQYNTPDPSTIDSTLHSRNRYQPNPDPQEAIDRHLYDDLDQGALSHHHTIGVGDNQALSLKALTLYHTKKGWTAPTLLNSWVDYGSGFNPSGYLKDALGFVHLRGLIKSGTAPTSIFFVLPVGYRPLYTNLYNVHAGGANGRVDIDAAGNVYIQSYNGGNNGYISLDGITFATF